MEIEIGIDKEQRAAISEGLSRLLADSYMLYLKSHNYHWNVTGTLFHPLHEMFEEQYTELAGAVDEIAERIRALGSHAPGSFREFAELTSIKEEKDEPNAMEMIKRATEAHEAVIRTARAALGACEDAGDEASLDLITQRLHTHSKAAWMLRSHLE